MTAMLATPWGRQPIPPRILPREAAPVRLPARQAAGAADLFALPESAALLLALVASCEGRAPERVLADAVAFYAEHKVGLPMLADHDEMLRGWEAASRLAHTQEIAGASPAPATSFPCDDAIAVAGADLRSGEPPP